MTNNERIADKMEGCLLGQAIGDALGLGSEFMSKSQVVRTYPDGLRRYAQIIRDSHRRRWPRGAWTDDTDMMLCIMDAFTDGHFDPHAVALNFKKWFDSKPSDMGRHTFNVLYFDGYVDDPVYTAEKVWTLNHRRSAANGAIMRTSVLGLPHGISNEEIESVCRLTHPDPRCIGSCVIVSRIINRHIWLDADTTLDQAIEIAEHYDSRIREWLELAHDGQLSELRLDGPDGMGYTLRTLGAALWAYWHSGSFTHGLVDIVNQGGDADTNGAVTAAILGAKFGASGIPDYYIRDLNNSDKYLLRIRQFISLLNTEDAECDVTD